MDDEVLIDEGDTGDTGDTGDYIDREYPIFQPLPSVEEYDDVVDVVPSENIAVIPYNDDIMVFDEGELLDVNVESEDVDADDEDGTDNDDEDDSTDEPIVVPMSPAVDPDPVPEVEYDAEAGSPMPETDETLVPDPPLPSSYIYVWRTTRKIVDDYRPSSLQSLALNGATFYAMYDNDTEQTVTWDQIVEPTYDVSEAINLEALQIADANNQHFWTDSNGAHVTDNEQDDWNTEYEKSNHGSLSSPTDQVPWHNLLMNSLGILLRRGLLNLVSVSKSAISFYDGLGNQDEDITAYFGRTSAQIGRTGAKHITLTAEGITAYNADGTVAPIQAANISAAEANIEQLQAATADISTIRANSAKVASLTADALTAATAYIAALNTLNVTANDISANKATLGSLITGNVTTDTLKAASAYISALNSANVTANDISANKATINSLIAGTVTADTIRAASAYVSALTSASVTADDISANKATINSLVAGDVTADTIRAASAYVAALTSASVTANDISANKATLGALIAGNVTTDTLRAASAYISSLNASNITASTITADHANVNTIIADYLTSADIQAEQIRVGQLLAGYVETDFSNADVAWIENGTIKDGAITNAMINSVSANKLTAGTIDASNITVTNLNADNITTGTINGQRIGAGSLSLDKLSDDVYTETEVDSMLATMQAEIDGAIETWTGTAIPTLSNAPANGWTDTATRDRHVGDVYFVVNSQSQQNGYNYRFTKSGSGNSATYSWQLIKDNDVTNALQRLTTAEGKITTFDSDISQLKTDTGSLTTRTTTLETRADGIDSTLLDKVDVTDFNSLEDTVDGHTQTLSQHTTAISNKADSSTVTAVTNRVSQNEQNISGITTRVGSLETTVATKADNSTVTTVSNNLSTLSQTVGSFQSTVASTYATKDESYANYLKTQSRGEQLITNGNGMMGNNTNFSSFVFDGSKTNGSPGSFTKTTSNNAAIYVDEYFPVDPSKEYEAGFDVLSSGDGVAPRLYAQLHMYDSDKKVITAQHVSYFIDTTTTLAQALNTGDTSVYLTDATNWHDTTRGHQRSLIFWNYSNSSGYLYPVGTYSRNFYSDLYEGNASVNKQTGQIALKTAWTGPNIPAGTPVSQNSSGSNYAYFWFDNNGTKIPVDEWLHVSGLYSGTKGPQGVNSPVPPSTSFWHGTAYCKIGWLWNYQSSTTGTQRRLWVTNVSMKIKNASIADVNAAVEAIPRMAKINMASRNFTLSQWNNYGAVGHVENWSTGSTYDNSHLRVGDRAYLIGTISDKNAGSATIIGEVTNVVPTGVGTSYITLKTEQLIFGGDVVTAVESRVSTAESTIVQHTNSIALKANSADVYTKTQSDGLISTEVTNRNAAIQVATEGITSMVSETYTSKEELSNALDSRVHDNDSWLYRPVPADIRDGIATIESISGNTVVLNQMRQVGSGSNTQTHDGISWTKNSDGSVVVGGTATASGYLVFITTPMKQDHKYLIKGCCPAGGSAGTYCMKFGTTAYDTGSGGIYSKTTADSSVAVSFSYTNEAVVPQTTLWPQLFDLTRMFGEGNEPSTVAEFERMFPEPYYPYDAGSLLSVNLTGVESVGFNQWDEVWEVGGYSTANGNKNSATTNIRSANMVPVMPSTQYHMLVPHTSVVSGFAVVLFYGEDGAYLHNYTQVTSNGMSFTVPSDAHYLTFYVSTQYGTTYNHDICINISNPALNGTYKPYATYQRTIPASTYFPNGMRSVGTIHDELTSDEAITRIEAVDLGTLTWIKGNALNDGTGHTFRASYTSLSGLGNGAITCACAELYCPPYKPTWENLTKGEIEKQTGAFIVGGDSSLTANEFKTSLSGVIAYIALATPVTTTIDLPLTYRVEQSGTERVTHTNPIAAPTIDIQYGLSTIDSISDALLRMDSAESSIIQNATDISLKVSKNDVINQINVSTEGVTINANRVDITGEAVFSAINNDTGTTKINGGKIDATAITIGQSQVTGLSTALNGKADDSDISAIQDDLNSSRVWYAVCDTVAATVSKVATISPATTDFTLEIGRMVNVRFVNTNTGAVGSLTLNVNGTGAKPIKNFYNGGVSNISSAGYLKANSIITFKYDGTNWVTDLTVNSTYNQGVNQLYNAIKAKTSITAQSIIVGDANGYSMAAAGISFDLAYPILWTTANIAANGTNYANVFTSHYNLDLATNHGFSSGTPNSIVYLVGTVTGNTFTLASSYLTTTVPVSEDGYCYIPIGRLGDTSTGGNYFYFFCVDKPTLYTYKDGLFGPASIREASAAAKTATNYISLDSTGIRIANENPATATTYQHQTAANTEFIVDGVSSAEFSGSGGRIGSYNGIYTVLNNNQLTLAGYANKIFSVEVEDVTPVPEGDDPWESVTETSATVSRPSGVTDWYISINQLWIPFIRSITSSNNTLVENADYILNKVDGTIYIRSGINAITINYYSIPTKDYNTSLTLYDGKGIGTNNKLMNISNDSTVIGKSNNSHMQLDYHSMQLIDKGGTAYFYVSDLRDETGVATITERFYGDGSTTVFTVSLTVSTEVSATVSNDSNNTATRNGSAYVFTSAPSVGSVVTIVYKTTSDRAKAYTLGRRYSSNLGPYSMAEGINTDSTALCSHAEGFMTKASGNYAHAEGNTTEASSTSSHAEGDHTEASGMYSHAEGNMTKASKDNAHAEGYHTEASGNGSHAEGFYAEATVSYAHAEGSGTHATGYSSHAEGRSSISSGDYSHAEGNGTASGHYSHVEGGGNTASGHCSHAEGGKYSVNPNNGMVSTLGNIASGIGSHAEGILTQANGEASHAGGYYTVVASNYQTAIGKYNDNNSSNVFEIGNGTGGNARSNALTVDWSGNVDISGGLASNGAIVSSDTLQAHGGREIFGGTSGSVILQHKDANDAEDFRIQFYVDSNGHPALRGSLDGGSTWEYPYPNQYASHTANTVWATPNGSNGSAGFRSLVAADIPNLNASKITDGNLDIPGTIASDGAITSGAAIYAHDGQEIFGGTDALIRIYHKASGSEDFRFDFYIDSNGNPAMRASLDAGSSWKYPYLNQLSSRTANTVLAGPNGSNGAPSFRALVAADIPNLNTSKITGGTLGTARGGTGVSGRQSSTITVDTSNVTVGDTNHCWHNGVVCSFSYNFKVKASLANNGTLTVGTLPSGYRPPYTFVGSAYTSTASAQADVSISTAGVITIRNVSGAAIATSVTIRVGATFAL